MGFHFPKAIILGSPPSICKAGFCWYIPMNRIERSDPEWPEIACSYFSLKVNVVLVLLSLAQPRGSASLLPEEGSGATQGPAL